MWGPGAEKLLGLSADEALDGVRIDRFFPDGVLASVGGSDQALLEPAPHPHAGSSAPAAGSRQRRAKGMRRRSPDSRASAPSSRAPTRAFRSTATSRSSTPAVAWCPPV
ncbi:hypothetical protein [Leucobacter soli]|uniref:hypothetical protein n=1 Tax=Leucobacter soli TaxID=2812850 RepID=UPI0036086F83